MKIFGDICTSMFVGFAFIGLLAIVNKALPLNPALDHISVLLALICIVTGVISFLLWHGFHQPSTNTLWARIARAMRENW